jgi:hypothetical protein
MANRTTEVSLPTVSMVEWIGGREIAAFMSDGSVYEVELPWIESAEHVRVIDMGMGLDLGDGTDVCSEWIVDEGRKIFQFRPWLYGVDPIVD